MKYRTECPKCKSKNLDRCFMHPHGGNQMERAVLCLDCGHSWLEIYDMVLVRVDDGEPDKPAICDVCPNESYKHCGQCVVLKNANEKQQEFDK